MCIRLVGQSTSARHLEYLKNVSFGTTDIPISAKIEDQGVNLKFLIKSAKCDFSGIWMQDKEWRRVCCSTPIIVCRSSFFLVL